MSESEPEREAPDDERRSREPLERKFELLLRALMIAGALLVGGYFIGFIVVGNTAEKAATAADDANDAIAQSEVERSKRVAVVAQIVGDNCATNNQQDQLLARVLATATDPNNGFDPASLNTSTLNDFDIAVAASIDRITQLQAQTSPQIKDLQALQVQLEALQNCARVVRGYLAGTPVPSADGPVPAIGDAVGAGASGQPKPK